MDIMNCRSCGRLFNYLSGPQICPNCKSNMEKKFAQVKQYIEDNPGVTMNEVCENNDVSRRQVEMWVREERLSFSTAEGSGIGCKRCGKPIASGNYCDKCKKIMANTLNEFYKDDTKLKAWNTSSNGKMRFLEK